MLQMDIKTLGRDRADIQPVSGDQIPGLQEMLRDNFMIENPAKTFAQNMKLGAFDDMPQEEVAQIAECASALSDAWLSDPEDEASGQATMNVLQVLSRLMLMYVSYAIPDRKGSSEVS